MYLNYQSKLCCEAAPECSICFESISSTCRYVAKCEHTFHINCISKWCKTNNSCPLCRKSPLMDVCKSSGFASGPDIYNNINGNITIINNIIHDTSFNNIINNNNYDNVIINNMPIVDRL